MAGPITNQGQPSSTTNTAMKPSNPAPPGQGSGRVTTHLSLEQQAAMAVGRDRAKRAAGMGARAHTQPMGPPPQPTYTYTNLVDLKVNNVYNIYGVVVSFKGPSPTRGTDMMMNLVLIDPSQPDPKAGLAITLFGRQSTLPQVTAAGQIIRIHRLKIQAYNGKRQGLSNRSTAYLVLSGRAGADLRTDLSRCPQTPTFDEQDFTIVRDLRLWRRSVTGWHGNYMKTIGELNPYTNYADLVVQVLSIRTTIQSNHSICDMSVWDGTSNETSHITAPGLDRATLHEPTLPPELTLGPGKFVGDILSVTAWGIQANKFANCPLGQWIYIRNARVVEKFGGIQATVEAQSTASQVSVEDIRVDRLLALYQDRVHQARGMATIDGSNATGPDPVTGTCIPNSHSTIMYPRSPLSAISDILQSTQVPAIYHIHARVKYHVPMEPVDVCKYLCRSCQRTSPLVGSESHSGYQCVYCHAREPADSPHLRFTYLFRLTLEDDTGAIDARVFDQDGTLFFNNLEAQDLHCNPGAAHRVADVLSSLLMEERKMDVCIKSYRKVDEPNTVLYRVFGTAITGFVNG